MRFVRRTVAPLLTGALTAGVLVAVAGSDVLPFSGVLAQATDEPATTDSTIPADELDLDELIAEGTPFDFDSVFVDLEPVGDFPGLYEYGDQAVTENVAAELELLVPGFEDPDDGGPIVTELTAARRFLLDDECNGILAMAMRKQVTRPVLARILRPDEAAIDAVTGPAEGTATIAANETDPLGLVHVLPLESVVEVGRVTVTVLDLDLVRARRAAVLSDFVAGEPGLSELLEGEVSPDAVGTPEFFEAVWTACLLAGAEEGTVPVPQTLRGQDVWTLKRDHPPDVSTTARTPDIDTVAWLEDGLEIRVEGTFLRADDNLNVDFAVDLDTQTWLEHLADSVEPAMDVAARLVSRNADELELLEREAFAPIQGFEYGDEVTGTGEAVRSALRRGEETLATLLSEEAAEPAEPAADDETGGSADRVLRATARPVFRPGQVATNLRRTHSFPPNGFLETPDAHVQMVVWDPEYLNSDAFRDGWLEGLLNAANGGRNLVALEEAGLVSAGEADALRAAGVADLVVTDTEGVFRTDYLMPCYSVTVSSLREGDDLRIARLAIRGQEQRRKDVFGNPFVLFEGEEPETAEPANDELSPLLDDLDRDYPLAALKAFEQREEEEAEATRAARAEADARAAAFCSAANLQEHMTGQPVEDADNNGIADRLPENDVGKLEDDEDTADAGG